jgi:predicted Zn-dependent protease
MAFEGFESAAVARALAEVADQAGDMADAYFERLEEAQLLPDDEGPAHRLRREEGLAVRLVRGGRTWLAGRDGISGRNLLEAIRQVARAQPRGVLPETTLTLTPWAVPQAEELVDFAAAVEEAIRAQHVAFGLRLAVRRHRRWLQVAAPRLVPQAQSESFYSVVAETPWGTDGDLFPVLSGGVARELARALVDRFRAREAPPPESGSRAVVLAPHATAVLVHEAVSHALEVDTLARGAGAAVEAGARFAARALSVLDDPSQAPDSVRRDTDDEGVQVFKRWLLREGVVEQPIADSLWARGSEAWTPGAARRSSRHLAPVPRSTHLELVAGEMPVADLLAGTEGGLHIERVSRGSLDPETGRFRLMVNAARAIHGGVDADPVGPFILSGRLGEFSDGAIAVGSDLQSTGAGWCAKGGQRLPVWARCPSMRIEGVEVSGA